MKRYMVIAGGDYYPLGGMGDFIGAFDDFQDACVECSGLIVGRDWVHVYDTEKMLKVFSLRSTRSGVNVYVDDEFVHICTYENAPPPKPRNVTVTLSGKAILCRSVSNVNVIDDDQSAEWDDIIKNTPLHNGS